MDLLALADFDLVAIHGSYSEASRRTGRPKATLSRRVTELEDSLGVRLVERGARPLRLTEAGAALHARTRPLLGELAEAGELVSAMPGHPRGRLSVSAPVMLSDMVLGRIAASFLKAHPEVRLEITAEDRIADIAADGYDLAIRVNPSADERLVGRRVFRDAHWLVASPSLDRPAAPIADAAIPLSVVVRAVPQAGATWRIRDGGSVATFAPEPVLRLSSLPMLRDAVVAGAGAALLPRSLVGHDVAVGRLACWGLEDGPPTELWALHTSRRLVSPKVTAFVRHLAAELADKEDLFRSVGATSD